MPQSQPKPFRLRRKSKSTNTPAESPESMTFQDYLEEADLCCEHARIAGRQRRFGAARGLFETAASLYRRALDSAGNSQPTVDSRLRGVEAEMSAYTELARSLARPLQRSG